VAHTVAGVLPRGTELPEGSKVWVLSNTPVPPSPLSISDPTADRDVRYFSAIGRLAPGITLQQARLDLERVAATIQRLHPQTAAGRTIRLAPIFDDLVEGVRWGLLVLQSAVGLVLLVACANVSSLLIARASGRRRELAIRAALGAGPRRLARQLLVESLLLGAVGGLAGLLLATWLVGVIVAVLPDAVPRSSQITIDPVVASVALGLALLTSMVFGVLPSLQGAKTDAAVALKSGGDRGSSLRTRGRAALVIGEMALTLILLAAAGLLVNSLMRLRGVDSGMQPEHVTVLNLALPSSRYATDTAQSAAYGRLLELLSAQPAIQAVGVGFPGPLRGSNASGSFFIDGRPSTDRSEQPNANLGSVSGGFFSAMGIPIVQGRTFDERDGAKAPGVALANVTLARTYWPGESPLGKRVRFDADSTAPWITIVGLVGDVRQHGLDQAPPPILYIPYRQFVVPFTNVVVRSTAPAGTVASLLRTAVVTLDPDLPADEITSLQTVLDRSVDQPRFRATLIGAFAIAALLLAAVGVYGLMSHSVTERTRDIGIRIALGAQPWQVLAGIMKEGLVLALAGIGIGLASALLAVRVIASFLYGVGAADPLTLGSVALLLLIVALAASYIPSRRALRVDPIAALRGD
ncbi:MAG: ADOP family duplicated permease, partial [Vicinamibacterales bacterium]